MKSLTSIVHRTWCFLLVVSLVAYDSWENSHSLVFYTVAYKVRGGGARKRQRRRFALVLKVLYILAARYTVYRKRRYDSRSDTPRHFSSLAKYSGASLPGRFSYDVYVVPYNIVRKLTAARPDSFISHKRKLRISLTSRGSNLFLSIMS